MAEGHRAVSVLYQALLTGLVLTLVTRRSEDEAADFVFRLFRRQHLEKFLPGLAKLGLDRLPSAVACAQYHYLSNQMGGVKTEYAYESDRKAWVRYPPPRWIWYGSAICGIPSRVEAFMYSKGASAYGGYPDIDELFLQQARERDRAKREALLHRIQQITIDRVMFAPVMDLRGLIGVGPRVADHTVNSIPMFPFPSYEDMRLKNP